MAHKRIEVLNVVFDQYSQVIEVCKFRSIMNFFDDSVARDRLQLQPRSGIDWSALLRIFKSLGFDQTIDWGSNFHF